MLHAIKTDRVKKEYNLLVYSAGLCQLHTNDFFQFNVKRIKHVLLLAYFFVWVPMPEFVTLHKLQIQQISVFVCDYLLPPTTPTHSQKGNKKED